MTDYSLFNHSSAPAGSVSTWASDPTTYRFVTRIKANTSGEVTSIWVYIGNTEWAGKTGRVFIRGDESQLTTAQAADLYTQNFVGRATAGWQEIVLTTPFVMAAGDRRNFGYTRVANSSYFTRAAAFDYPVESESGFIVAQAMTANGVYNGLYSTSADPTDPVSMSYTPGVWYGTDITFTKLLQVDLGPPVAIESDLTQELVATTSTASGLTYAWTKVSGPACTLNPNNTAQAEFTPTGGPGTYVIQIAVTDSEVTITDTVTITVTAPLPTRPVTVTAAADWVTVGGGTATAALGDPSPGTYLESVEGPDEQLLVLGLEGMLPPEGDLVIWVELSAPGSETSTLQAWLVRGTTTVSIAETLTDLGEIRRRHEVRFTAPSLASITEANWADGDLSVHLFATAAN